MASSVLPIVLAGTGVALVATGGEVKAAGAPRRGEQVNPKPQPPAVSPTGFRALKEQYGINALVVGGAGIPDPMIYAPRMESFGPSLPREVADEIVTALKKDFDKMSGEARVAACRALKVEFPDEVSIQQLDCNQPTWELFIIALSSAAGAAIGTWLGGPYGGVLGSIIGGYSGKLLVEYGDDAWRAVSGKAEEYYDESLEWGEGVVDDVGDWLGSVF